MEDNSALWSMKPFKHRKGVPGIPNNPRPEVPADWTDEIARLEKFFVGIVLPASPFSINAWTTTTDLPGCIESGISNVKANNGNRYFLPYLEQLQEIELMLLPEKERETRKAELIPKPIKPTIQKVNGVRKSKKSVRKEKPTKQIPKWDKWDYESFYDD
jgi:hypothetical protein